MRKVNIIIIGSLIFYIRGAYEIFLREKKHYTAMIGGVSAVGCLAVFGAESFILPAMGLILAAITLLRKPIEKAGGFL